MQYRILKPLKMGTRTIPRGGVQPLDLPPESLAKLIKVGAISEVKAPPLSALPGWEERAEALEDIGIHDANDFLDATPGDIARACDVSVTTVYRWRSDLREYIKP